VRAGFSPGPGQYGLGRSIIEPLGNRRWPDGSARQPVQKLVRGGPGLRVFGQRRFDQRLERVWYRRDVGVGVQHPVQDRIGIPGAERRMSDRRVGDRHAPDEDVGRRARAPGDLLRRHETHGADHHARFSDRGRVQRVGDSEIDDLGAVLRQDDVGRLEIPVHDSGRVNDGQRLGQPGRQAIEHVGVQASVRVDVLVQRGTGGVLGGHERQLRIGIGLDDPDRAHSPDPRQHGHLTAEAPPEIRVIGQFRAQHLHRGQAAVRGYPEIHHAHTADAQPSGQAILSDPRGITRPKRRASQ
jgi:hypothetical protein